MVRHRYLEEAVRKYGRIGIHFKLYRLGKGTDNSFSMANRGFAPILHLVMKENQEYLELQIHEMMASSRVDGKPMQGHVNTLKYEDHGHIAVAEIEGNKLYIPLDACRMHCRPGSELVGIIPANYTEGNSTNMNSTMITADTTVQSSGTTSANGGRTSTASGSSSLSSSTETTDTEEEETSDTSVGQWIFIITVSVLTAGFILMEAGAGIVYYFRKNWYRWGGGEDDEE